MNFRIENELSIDYEQPPNHQHRNDQFAWSILYIFACYERFTVCSIMFPLLL